MDETTVVLCFNCDKPVRNILVDSGWCALACDSCGVRGPSGSNPQSAVVQFRALAASFKRGRTQDQPDEAIRVIKSMAPPDPSVEQCLEAFNRANVRGNDDWHILVASKKDNLRFFYDETKAIGKMLIERERAEAAKGGA